MDFAVFQGAYCGPAPLPSGLWAAWNFDPPLLAALAALAILFRQNRAGLAAVAVLVLALVSPLCALASGAFSVRVLHHLLLVAVAAPLAAVAWPARHARMPVLAFLLATVALWVWHLPAAYDLALSDRAIYWVMQLALFCGAVALWRLILQPDQPVGVALVFVFASYLQMALLGALLTLAPQSLYAAHATAPLLYGLSPLADQQLGGLIMWVPASLPYLVAGAILARRGWREAGGTT